MHKLTGTCDSKKHKARSIWFLHAWGEIEANVLLWNSWNFSQAQQLQIRGSPRKFYLSSCIRHFFKRSWGLWQLFAREVSRQGNSKGHLQILTSHETLRSVRGRGRGVVEVSKKRPFSMTRVCCSKNQVCFRRIMVFFFRRIKFAFQRTHLHPRNKLMKYCCELIYLNFALTKG